jgi:hypothetical protein
MALCLALVLSLSISSPMRATDSATSVDTSASLSALVDRDPEEVLAWDAAGQIEALIDGLDPYEAMIAGEAARTLNEASAAGYLVVSDDFRSVKVTRAGRDYVKGLVRDQTAGCDRVTSVSADWLGFHVEIQSKCTQAEFEARHGLAAQAESPVATEAPAAAPDSPITIQSHESWNCLLSVIATGVAVVGLLVFLAAPPFGWLFWVSWGVTGVGGFLAWFAANDACFGIHDVDKQVRVGGSVYRYNCYYRYNTNWVWNGHRWIPTYERWEC